MKNIEKNEAISIVEALMYEVHEAAPEEVRMADRICGGCGNPNEGIMETEGIEVRTCEYCASVYASHFPATFKKD